MIFKSYIPDRFSFGLLFLVAILAGPLFAQSGNVDLGFSALPSTTSAIGSNFQQIVQPDGKILVYGNGGIFRLNSDGTGDPTFSYCNCGGVSISSVKVAADGKVIIGGTAPPNHAKLIRLNSDGSIDNSFSVFIAASGSPDFTNSWFTVNAIQPDGKVIATHGSWGNIMGTWYSFSMRRYDVNASVDSSFTAPALSGGHLMTTTSVIELLPDGRFYLALSTSHPTGGSITLSRRFADGTIDATFTQFTRSITLFSVSIADMAATGDGGVLAAGFLWPSMTGGPYNQNLLKFLPSGAVDPGFNPPLSASSDGVHLLPDGKILYSVQLTSSSQKKIIRLDTNGAIDNTYVMDPSVTSILNTWSADSMGRVVFIGATASGNRMVRLLANGGLDPTFNPFISVPSSVSRVAVQGDGKVVVSGPFSYMNGVSRNTLARLNADGTLDTTFDPGIGFSNNPPAQIILQADGKILAAGQFTSYNGTAVPGIVRLNTNGSIDSTFSVSLDPAGRVEIVALQPDGKILIGGSFASVNGVNRKGVARVDSGGVLDPTFDVVFGNDPTIYQILVEPSGKIIIGGAFSGVHGVPRTNFARLESNGALDQTFNAGSAGILRSISRQPDGKYVVTEAFASDLLRRNNDGSVDASFTPPPFTFQSSFASIDTVLLLADGSMLVGGNFDNVGGTVRRNLTRLGSSGAHYQPFMPNGVSGRVSSLASYPGGKVMVGGSFSSVDNVTRFGLARLNASALQRSTPFDFDGDGRADVGIVRPTTGDWYILPSTGGTMIQNFGLGGDISPPADYDGDGKTDLGMFRPSTGTFWYKSSISGAFTPVQWGAAGDVPRPSDFDADGKADFVIYRPATGSWYRRSATGAESNVNFGLPTDLPVIGDFDGDRKADPAIFRPSTGTWWYLASTNGTQVPIQWGLAGDIPAPADYDGDGRTDIAIYRPSTGSWYILGSQVGFFGAGFGLPGDRPVAADFDGDGKADIAVFRPSTAVWYILQSTSGFVVYQWGLGTDVAIPNSFVP